MFLENIPISKILYCSKIYTRPEAVRVSKPRHAHALVYFIEGNCEYVYSDKTYTATPGSVLFLPYGKEYIIHRHSTAQCIYIDFLTLDGTPVSPFVKNYPNASQFRDVFTGLYSLYKQKRIGYECEMMSMLYKLISLIQIADRTSYLPGVKYQKIAAAVDYINKNYCNGQIRVSYLAKLSGVSTRYFGELFTVFFGVSPKEYIIRMQLETAKNLLISTSDTISNIADTCGFGDVYYFSKMFRKATGETPSAFRKANNIL